MKEIIEKLRIEAENIRSSSPNKGSFQSFILKLKNSVNQLRATQSDNTVHDYLTSLDNFRTFDQLSWISRLLHHMVIFKARPNYYDNWNEKGRYLYDLDTIITKLDALLFRLNKNES
jgi:hypothetical protein